jgi:hypothetical protein
MTESNDRKDAIAYYKKVNKLREETLKCDFSKDKKIPIGGLPVPYLSAEKIRQQFRPLFTRVGLEYEISYSEPRELTPVGSKQLQHWAITLKIRMIDVDTGYAGAVCEFVGEGSDTLDKAIRKAMTAAYKSWLSDMFGIEEGIDPETPPVMDLSYTPKTPEEKVELKAKIAAQAVKPTAAPAKPAAPKAEKPADKPTAPAPKKDAPAADVPAPGCDVGFKANGPMENTLKERYVNWRDEKAAGRVTEEQFSEMEAAYKKISNMQDALSFNTKYPKILVKG